MNEFMITFLDLLFLLLLWTGVYFFSKKVNIPYTIMLVLVGALLVPISHLPGMEFIQSIELTPDLLFYVFLPVLLFESAYQMRHKEITKDNAAIRWLAIVWLLISAAVIGLWGYWILQAIGRDVPLEVTFLFGAIVSATDPVAVLALFKEYGAPKRLSLLFEGESLFNDGTGLALFLVVYEMVSSGVFSWGVALTWLVQFAIMIIWGILLGIGFGVVFSHAISRINNNPHIELIFTMILAHLTFLTADLISHNLHIWEFHIMISGVIATTFAALTMGNYGRTKISPQVEHTMEQFWWFFGFISNTLVFLLMGLMVQNIQLSLLDVLPIVWVLILVTIIGRAVSVFATLGVTEAFRRHKPVPTSRKILLARWSLRGALAFMMVLLIADTFTLPSWVEQYSIKELLIVAVISKIFFSIFIKWMTMTTVMNKLGILQIPAIDKMWEHLLRILLGHKMLERVDFMRKHYTISQEHLNTISQKYQHQMTTSKHAIQQLVAEFPHEHLDQKIIQLYALGLEKKYLRTLYEYDQLWENMFAHRLHNIDIQVDNVISGKPWIKDGDKSDRNYDIMDKMYFVAQHITTTQAKFLKYRAKVVVTSKVIGTLNEIKKLDLGISHDIINEIVAIYSTWNARSAEKLDTMLASNEKYQTIHTELIEKGLVKREETYLSDINVPGIFPEKVYEAIHEECEHKLYTPSTL